MYEQDMWASVSMAKKGLGDGAIANATGAQVCNVLLGVGLPFFCYTVVNGPVVVRSDSCAPEIKYSLFFLGCFFLLDLLYPKLRTCDTRLSGREGLVTFSALRAGGLLLVYSMVMGYVITSTLI